MSHNNGLNPRQLEAVMSKAHTTVVLAGPGSGKTRTLTHRIAYLVREQGVKPWNILAVTFTNKATKEMSDRLAALLSPAQAEKITVKTFHSFGAMVLRSEMGALAPLLWQRLFTTLDRQAFNLPPCNLSTRFTIYDDADQQRLLGRVLEELNIEAIKGGSAGDITRWKNKGLLPSSVELIKGAAESTTINTYRQIYLLYQAHLMGLNGCDFDDLILYPLLLFQWVPDKLKAYQRRFPHVLIDEYQDTNGVQYELANLLAGETGHLFVVGDIDQAIYGFRFADYGNIARLRETRPGHRLVLLEQNYRSGAKIIRAANSLIANNTRRVEKRLYTENGFNDHVEVIECGDERGEADAVARLVKQLRRQGMAFKEIAVLYRIHALSRELEAAFLRHGLPYTLLRGTAFYDRAEIKDVLSYLRVIYNGDALAFERAANRPRRGLGEKAVVAILAAAQDNLLSWLDRFYESGQMAATTNAGTAAWKSLAAQFGLAVGPGVAQKVWEMAGAMARLRRQLEKGASVADLIRSAIGILRPHFEAMDNSEERLENAKELLTVAGRVEANGEEGLAEFLETVALASAADDIQDNSDRVILGTLHSSKGLEFNVVVLTGAEAGLCPHIRSTDNEEERRLFYVGVTRARRQLYILWTQVRTLFGEARVNQPSPYLMEMDVE